MSPQICEFHLPLSPEELLKSGGVNQYVVQEVLSIRHLPSHLKAFQTAFRAQGPLAVLEHFDTIYSILHHFRSIDPGLKEDTLEFLIKVVSRHSQELPAVLDDAALSMSDRSAHLNALKMNCYALIRLLESFETMSSQTGLMDLELGGKGRKSRAKATHGFDWEEERQPILQLLTQLLQLDIRHLWNHSIIEEEFVSLVTGCCYRLLENPTISHQKNRPTREAITHLLGVALTRYNHMLSATVKIIQMLQHFEHLASILVAAVSLWATDYGMKSIVGEIVREIGQKCPQELSRDPTGAKGFAAFLTELAERIPAILMSSMCILLDHLDGENYTMRNAVLAAMAEMVLQVLSGDQLEEASRDTRDQFLDTLQAHCHDVNSFVRSRVLQLFTRIVQQKALPLTRFQAVVALAVGRLADKSVLVCKSAIQLLASFLANNPFSCKLSDTDLAGPLQKETQKLQEMRAQRRATAPSTELDPTEEWEAMLPELKATLQQLLTLPQEGEGMSEGVAETETPEEVEGRIRRLLTKASYKQAIILTQEAISHFQKSEPFCHVDPEESEETRFLSLLGNIFKGPSAPTQEENPQTAAGSLGPGETGCRDKHSGSEPKDCSDELVKQELLVQYLQDAHSFSLQITKAIGIISKMMYEHTTTVVQEVIEFFVMVFQFGVPQALFGVRRMLPLIWSKEPGVRDAVLNAYRQLYLKPKGDSARAKAQTLIHNLSLLLVDASVGTIQCLEEIICEFVQKDELSPAVTQVLWERATEKVPCSPLERCSSIMLLGMMARGKPEIVGSNLDTLVNTGLDEKLPPDYRLAQQVCHAIANISDRRKPSMGERHPPFRVPQEHRLFERLREMVTKGSVHPDPLWVPFKEAAVALIYQLAEGPEVICAQMLQDCAKQALEKLEEKSDPQEAPQETPVLPTFLLMNLLSLAGDVALQQLVHLEQAVSGELCRRRVLREEQEHKRKEPKEKNSNSESTLEEEMGLGGATADDTEAELIRGICELELLEGKQTLAAFVPLLLKVCNNPGLYSNPELSTAASLALGKFCMISATFCDSQLRLLFTMLEKSSLPIVRSNLMIATGDLAIRFPNLVDPWTPHLYARLRDPSQHVRKTAALVMTHLILKDMVKVKGQVSEMAVLLIDPAPQIAALAKNFFNELSNKANAIYNLLPDIISRLSAPEGGVEEEPFHTIMKQLLSYITKDKQTESLVEKLCQRFRTAQYAAFLEGSRGLHRARGDPSLGGPAEPHHTFPACRTERQYRDLAYCMSQLPLTERGLHKMLDNFDCFGDKLSDESIFSAFLSIVGKLRRGAKPEGKAVIDEFEQKLRACHTRGLDAVEELEVGQGSSQRAPSARKQPAAARHRHVASTASDDFVTPKPRRPTRQHPNTQQQASRKKLRIVFSSDESSDEELSAEMTEDETPKKTTPIRRASAHRHRS